MTRKDFILLARALDDARIDSTGDPVDRGIDLAALYIADALGKDNQRFDRQRFLLAAGVPGDIDAMMKKQAD